MRLSHFLYVFSYMLQEFIFSYLLLVAGNLCLCNIFASKCFWCSTQYLHSFIGQVIETAKGDLFSCWIYYQLFRRSWLKLHVFFSCMIRRYRSTFDVVSVWEVSLTWWSILIFRVVMNVNLFGEKGKQLQFSKTKQLWKVGRGGGGVVEGKGNDSNPYNSNTAGKTDVYRRWREGEKPDRGEGSVVQLLMWVCVCCVTVSGHSTAASDSGWLPSDPAIVCSRTVGEGAHSSFSFLPPSHPPPSPSFLPSFCTHWCGWWKVSEVVLVLDVCFNPISTSVDVDYLVDAL